MNEYCPYANCRRPLHAGATFCAGCGRPIRICPRCRNGNRHDAKFCLRCGQRLEWGSPAQLTGLTALQQGRYVLQHRIDQGQGGMSAVYKAIDTRHPQQPIAIKEINGPKLKPTERDDILAAFTQEAAMLTRLHHPGLIKVFGSFEENQRHYMVMEFIPGRTLQDILQRDAPLAAGLPVDRVKQWAIQLCEVLGYLHAQTPKIIYRDMKPANVMALNPTAAHIKLLDFGIARFHKGSKTKDTVIFGTPGYAPPEQYGKFETDERADIYALGATLHHLLTGYDPSAKPFFFAPAHTLNPAVPLPFSLAIARAVDNNRDSRFASMVEMKSALLKT